MTPEGIVNMFRVEMNDEAIPHFWTDERLYPYLDDAQKMFARETGGIPDSTSSISQLSFSIGDTSLELDARILKVRDAYRLSDGRKVDIINYEDMEQRGIRFDGRTGPVSALIIGMDETTCYPYPVPSVADTLQLVIDRLPMTDIVPDEPCSLEIKPHHHMHLISWMKSLAYDNQDAEIFNKSKAVEFEEKFMAYCIKATQEKDRRKHKTRVVAYGGLPMSTRANDEDYRTR